MRACVQSPVRLDPMSHIVGLVCLDQLSRITSCNRFCGSRIAGVTSQDFNTMINKEMETRLVLPLLKTKERSLSQEDSLLRRGDVSLC